MQNIIEETGNKEKAEKKQQNLECVPLGERFGSG